MKRLISFIITILILSQALVSYAIDPLDNKEWWMGGDLSSLDLSKELNLLLNSDFSTETIFPSKDKLPSEFIPSEIIEWGKSPGLNVKKLHQQGLTGKGINIAFIDQPLLVDHIEYKDRNIKYLKVREKDAKYGFERSMHGPAVASVLVGNNLGVAPEANLYFVAHPSWLTDQTTHADSIYKIIDINKTLPAKDKIRLIGFSDGPDIRENNIDAFYKAIDEAEKSGIIVFTVSDKIRGCNIEPNKNRNDYRNFTIASWYDKSFIKETDIFVPLTYTLAGYENENSYIYWSEGGISWGMPFVVGLSALALQIDPTLTKTEILDYMYKSSNKKDGISIVNPEGFIELVRKNKKSPSFLYYFLYNSDSVSKTDLDSIKEYQNQLKDENHEVQLIDVSGKKDAVEVYRLVKKKYRESSKILKGIQIFGTPKDVPAFSIKDKVDMMSLGIHDLGYITSDHFYSNFNNDEKILSQELSQYKIAKDNIDVDFHVEWIVSRLPLKKGSYSMYFKKYNDYKGSDLTNVPLVNFSSPIFASNYHSDDYGYFISERLDKEWKILNNKQYKLYGNLQGVYPVQTDVLGDFNKENLGNKNKSGIVNFVINSQGQSGNVDKTFFKDSSKESETRESLINNSNVNSILDNNYYNMFIWNCWGASYLNESSISHKMISEGKAINTVASSYILSNNGLNNRATLSEMKDNNAFYFSYFYFKSLYKHSLSISESFFEAKRKYTNAILENNELVDGEGNYQFNLNNVLSLHHFGLIERTKDEDIKI